MNEWVVATFVPIFTSLGFFAVVGWIVWMWYRKRQRELEAQERFYPHLMEKFANAQEFADFLATEQGQNLIRLFAPARRTFRERVLFGMTVGFVLFTVGLAFIVAQMVTHEDPGLIIAGLLFAFPGLGFIAAALISLRLGTRWKLNGFGASALQTQNRE